MVYGRTLEHVASGSGCHDFLQRVLLPKTDQGNDPDLGMALAQGPGGGDAVQLGHHEVHQHYVRFDPVTHLDHFLAICCCTDQVQILESLKEHNQSIADQVMVVSDDHPDARF
jgi:hypothetical protein